MGSDFGILWGIMGTLVGVAVVILVFIYVLVPILKGIGRLVTSMVWLIGSLIGNVFRFITGEIKDTLRLVGAMLAGLLFCLLSVGNVIIGRWSSASHFGTAVQNEIKTGGACLYRIAIGHPLRLFSLESALEGVEQRLPEAVAQAPGADRPNRRAGMFDGYNIVGSLPSGGSGGRLYIAEPSKDHAAKISKLFGGCPTRVVIKSFAISDGSSLPQIVRESRALESAKQIGLVLEHQLSPDRFYYVMPYVAGEGLGQVVRNLHAQSGEEGLNDRHLTEVLRYMADLLQTLESYHRAGFWHKDIKPDNILVNEGRAEVVDFGLITPLRSAMTLTTHGTEYFRDPEMVRMALRGVKVHEVDGVKFDLYAAGAVLYYAVENTFPMHGGLSSLSKRCPDAVKWIVRRAMTDYAHRYDAAAVMLADVQSLLSAPDMFAVKMADLPSMRALDGEAARAAADEASSKAASPFGWGTVGAVGAAVAGAVGAAAAAAPPAAAAVAGAGAHVAGAGVHAAKGAVGSILGTGRPHLEVVNWWTGSYRVRSGGGVNPAIQDQLRTAGKDAAEAAQRFSRQVKEEGLFRAVGQVATGVAGAVRRESHGWQGVGVHAGEARGSRIPVDGRVPAREQVARAQSRAAVRRSRTFQSGPSAAPSERINPGMVIAAVVAVALGLSYGINRARDAGWLESEERTRVVMTSPTINPNLKPALRDAAANIQRALHKGEQPLSDVIREAFENVSAATNGFVVLDGLDPALVPPVPSAPETGEVAAVEASIVEPLSEVWAGRSRRFLLVNDHPAFRSRSVEASVKSAVLRLEGEGMHRLDDTDLEARVKSIMAMHATEAENPEIGKPADTAVLEINDAIAASGKDVGLVIWVYAVSGEADQIRYWVNVTQEPNSAVLASLLQTLNQVE